MNLKKSLLPLLFTSIWSFSPPLRLSFKGTVTILYALDGDSLMLLKENGAKAAVNLIAIDAPEFMQQAGMDFPVGRYARHWLSQELSGKKIEVMIYYSNQRGRRGMAKIFWPKGYQHLSLFMLEHGLAFIGPYSRFLSTREKNNAEALELAAKKEKRGYWALGRKLKRPWSFRRK